MQDLIDAARSHALNRIGAASTLDELQAVQQAIFAKTADLPQAKAQLGKLSPEDRKVFGQALNEATKSVNDALSAKRSALAAVARRAQLEAERLDLTERLTRPGRGHLHLTTQAWERLEDVFVAMGFTVEEGPEVEDDFHNFEALNMPPSHPARSMWDTLFVDLGHPGQVLLRTHTSPVQVRVMMERKPPFACVMPGRTFRRETADATHLAVFHQIEGLVIGERITFGDLAGTIDAFTKQFFGEGFGSRLRPSYFPFTEPSAEFDIQRPDGSWLELGGCGMVHPNVLRSCGIDPERWSGFAFGFGIDRMAKEFHGVDDLRDLYTNDVRFVEQF
ncbi:MAG: phenylalanine--tRNA ligase subunit alpha [Acidimicrobiia bacterium]